MEVISCHCYAPFIGVQFTEEVSKISVEGVDTGTMVECGTCRTTQP